MGAEQAHRATREEEPVFDQVTVRGGTERFDGDAHGVAFSVYVRPNGEVEHWLSDHVGRGAAAQLANRLRQIKGPQGGRVYINEVGEFFAPIDDGDSGVSYVYLGPLEDDPWFPAPDVPRA
jgi:hypothetical protein